MKPLQLVIPMSGLGSRFINAGYTAPKPLIEVQGRMIIDWLLRIFPGEDDPVFICRREHIETTPMRDILLALKPRATIAVIEGAKLGPVDALMKAAAYIADDRPALVSYCDYYMRWDYPAFKHMMIATGCAGAVPCYTGFHPNLLPAKNLYACCRTDAKGYLIEIKEKHSFDKDKAKALHSPGVYYFKSGALLKTYSQKLMAHEDTLNGEYYVSMIYNHIVKDGLPVYVPANVEQFCQWGTPEDLRDYLYWTQAIKGFAS